MEKTELDEEEQISRFAPATVRKRMYLLNDIVAELKRRKFRNLDETNPKDLKKVIALVQDMHPESNYYKVREYSMVGIRLWRKQRSPKQ
jgi:3-methyladenine DNA glycosylase Tag